MRKAVLFVLFFLVKGSAFSQGMDTIQFNFEVTGAVMVLNTCGETPVEQKLALKTFKSYLSQLTFYFEGKPSYTVPDLYFLLDMGDSNRSKLRCVVPKGTKYNQVGFLLGLDSATNVGGAMGGDLDPTLGLYWTWQSGYINMKIEGDYFVSPDSTLPFEYHLGGYAFPHSNAVYGIYPVGSSSQIQVAFNLKSCLENAILDGTVKVMSPSIKAVTLAQKIAENIEVR